MHISLALVGKLKIQMAQLVIGESGKNPVDTMDIDIAKLVYKMHELKHAECRQGVVSVH